MLHRFRHDIDWTWCFSGISESWLNLPGAQNIHCGYARACRAESGGGGYWLTAVGEFKYATSEASSVSILILHSGLRSPFHPSATQPLAQHLLIELWQQLTAIRRDAGCLTGRVASCCLHGWSLCVPLSLARSSSLSLTSLPAVFNGWVEAGAKERVSEADSGEEEDGRVGGVMWDGGGL